MIPENKFSHVLLLTKALFFSHSFSEEILPPRLTRYTFDQGLS